MRSPRCATCLHWRPTARRYYRAPCSLRAGTRLPDTARVRVRASRRQDARGERAAGAPAGGAGAQGPAVKVHRRRRFTALPRRGTDKAGPLVVLAVLTACGRVMLATDNNNTDDPERVACRGCRRGMRR